MSTPRKTKPNFTVERRRIDWSKGKNIDKYCRESRHKHGLPTYTTTPNKDNGLTCCQSINMTSPVYKWVK